jgi:hypothetical protein
MKVSTENDNNFGYEKITILVDNIPLSFIIITYSVYDLKLEAHMSLYHSPGKENFIAYRSIY